MSWAPLFDTPPVQTQGYSLPHPALHLVPESIPANGASIHALESGAVAFFGRDPDLTPEGEVNQQSRGIHLIVLQDDGVAVDYCHLAGVPWPDAPYYSQLVERGQHIAFCGYTGYTRPDNDPASSHVHLITLRDGVRFDPTSEIDWGVPQEGDMTLTDEQLRWLDEAWKLAERLDGSRKPQRLTTKAQKQYAGLRLKDVVRAMKGEPTHGTV